MKHKHVLIPLAAVALLCGGITFVAHAAAPAQAECVDDPGVDVTCTVVIPYPPAQTVTEAGPTSTVTATTTATQTVTVTTTPSASSSPTPTSTPTPTPTPTSTPTQPPASGFPTETTTGLPAGWTPAQTISGDYTIRTAGTVVQDLRVNGDIIVNAANVTLRRVDVVGGRIDNWPGARCNNGLKVYDSRVSPGRNSGGEGAVGYGGYTADNVLIVNAPEGFRVGAKGSGGCGPVTIANSYAHIIPPSPCGDWHGDGLQGYDGAAVTVRNSVLWLDELGGCGGTAPFFYPRNQGNPSVDVDGLIVRGGGYPFRNGMPGTVRNLHIVNGSWSYGPVDVACSALTTWQASISTLNAAGQPVVVRSQACTGSGT